MKYISVIYTIIILQFALIKQDEQNNIKQNEEEITFMAVGDIMMGTDFPNVSYLLPKNVHPFSGVKNILSSADVLFGNLEGTLSDTGKNAKRCKDSSKCYSFRSPESYVLF